MTMPPAIARRGWLHAVGLHRPELRAWALYDLASAVVLDVVVTAIFPSYFSEVAAAGASPAAATARFATLTTATLAVLAVLAPVLGALADAGRARKRMLAAFVFPGAAVVASLSLVQRGDWVPGAILFAAANVCAEGAATLHASLLPHVARPDELDRTSTAACALGYLGAGLILAAVLLAIDRPGWLGLPSGPDLTPAGRTLPVRLAFLLAAAWWIAFSIPLFRRVREPASARLGAGAALRVVAARLAATFGELRRRREAWRFLAASLLYTSGIGTIVRMAVIYGAEVGLERGTLVMAIVLVDLVGTPFAFLFGVLSARIGAKRAILLGLVVYAVSATLGYFMRTAAQFYALALLVATVQGGIQSLTRSMFASLVPAERSAEFFGFSTMAGNLTSMIGPGLFAVVATTTGSSRSAILSTIVLFAAGGALLRAVDVEKGWAAARDQNASSTIM